MEKPSSSRRLTTVARRLFTAAVVLVSVAAPTLPASAEQPTGREALLRALHEGHEAGPVGPYVEVPVEARRTSPARPWTRGTFTSVQVNVDSEGNNIVGDAANEPSIAVDPTAPNTIAIGWRQFNTITSSFRQAGIGYSTDGGRSWTFPGVLEPGVFRSDPVLDAAADGTFYYNSLTSSAVFECDVFTSADGGATWGPAVDAFGGDKQWMTVDRTAGVGAGNIYASWTSFYSCCGDSSFTRSTDGAVSFEGPSNLLEESWWGTLSVAPDGDLVVAGDSSFGPVVNTSSTVQDPMQPLLFDSWTPIDLGGFQSGWDGPNPSGLLGQLWVATDHSGGPTHGNVYVLASVDPAGPDPLDVHFARSTDGGASWSAPILVNDDVGNNWQWFGTMSVAPNGRIDVIWNDSRNDPGGYDSELYYASSSDGGVTWSASQPLSPAFDPHLGWPQQDKIGDYYDMVSDDVGAHVAYAATFNGEQDVYYLRIGDYDCNVNGVGDAEDLSTGTSDDDNGNGIPDECETSTIFSDGFESGDTTAWTSTVE